jgi:hypothetical protein
VLEIDVFCDISDVDGGNPVGVTTIADPYWLQVVNLFGDFV